jgi:hypothetical protein
MPPRAVRPAATLPPPKPQPGPTPDAGLVRQLRILSQDFARQQRKGRRPSPRAVELSIQAAQGLAVAHPDHAEAIWAELAWLARRRPVAGRP